MELDPKYCDVVSVPYKITLLSNRAVISIIIPTVSVPYKITLLSNVYPGDIREDWVSVPYKITLLSNAALRQL